MTGAKLEVIDGEYKPNPTFHIERKPSTFTGISWWAVLEYKEHRFSELLPADFPGVSEERRNEYIAKAGESLKAQLRPILEEEDGGGD